jgi:hypothetical protein
MSTNAIKSAVSQLTGEPVIVSPKSQMKFDLSKAEKHVIDAVKHQGTADGKWLKASDELYASGVRSSMLLEDGPDANEDVIEQVRCIIVKAWSPKVQALINMTKAELMGTDADERAVRQIWVKRIPVMMAYLRKHLKTHEDKVSKGNTTKTMADALIDVINDRIDKLQRAKAENLTCFSDVTETIVALRKVIATI